MLTILYTTFPFFALVFCGFVAARRGVLPLTAIGGMNAFVLFLALPCMLFRFSANMPLAQLFDPSVVVTYLLCGVVLVALVIALTRRGRIGWNDASFGALVGAFPNSGFMGIPMMVAIVGQQAAGTVMVTIMVDMVVTTSLCIALSRLDGHSAASALHAAKNALKGVLENPLPWAIFGGAAVSAFQLNLPQPLLKTIGLMADAASPVALFTIGAVLARPTPNKGSGHWMEVLPVAAIKLFLHPLLVWCAGMLAIQMGVTLSAFALKVLVLTAALPSASNVSLLAERFGADNGRVARIILVSTAAAFFSFAGIVGLMG
jgi:predicted permease